MKDIVIIGHFTSDFSIKGNDRFSYIGRLLCENNIVELITSDFSHVTKMKRSYRKVELPFKVTLVEEPGYSKNICLGRLYSHKVFAGNVKKYLYDRKVPEVLYCAVPSLDVADVVVKYAKKKKVKLILDIQDLWPEAFRMVFHIPVISDLLFYPMERKANRIYAAADEIVAVSQTYANRAAQVNKNIRKPAIVHLGTDLTRFDTLKSGKALLNKPKEEVWMAYVGSISSSYDLCSVIDAMVKMYEEDNTAKLRFVIMGKGPLEAKLVRYARKSGVPVTFTGFLAYPEMVAQLCRCDFAVNPIRKGSAGSILNKVGDYAAAGLAVINTQECMEYRKLITTYKAGINCRNGDIDQLSRVMKRLYTDVTMRSALGEGNRQLAEARFDRKVTYPQICSYVEERGDM